MTLVASISRFAKIYVFSPEAFILCILLLLLYNSFLHVKPLLKFANRARVKLQLKLRGQYDVIPEQGETEVSEEHTKASWELRKENVAVFAIQGRRPHMEDRFNVVNDLEHTDTSIYGMFDGHGGEFAADFVEKTLFKSIMIRLLRASLADESCNISAILMEEMLIVDKQLLEICKETMEISGTTALVAMLHDNQLTVANVGDSRGVICDKNGKMIPLSFDHKPQLVKERNRIRQAGGFISFNGVWRVAGVLATSRALGDYPLKEKNLVIADPDIMTFDLNNLKPLFMILATDGLWDCFSNDEAVEYIKDRLNEPHFGAKSLVLQAYYRGSVDNISVMVVNFVANRTSLYRTPSR
ncbi:protein phosphatase 1L-like [Gigantopelta aegis]|uniref:protein phosphatase 1L-like n=1 Tax=Gigantopelta aegis TaxID=1735272 RepID=UPI001B88CF0D|nr:protein phosphatase 1L-like [Gigantopelta aegis]